MTAGIPALDAIIVAYHSGGVLESCLAELERFLPVDARIVVVDNSPADTSAARAAAGSAQARVVSEDGNIGFAAAVNHGFELTTAPILALVNPDIARVEGSFATIERLFASSPEVGAVAVHLSDDSGALEPCRREPRLRDFVIPAVGAYRLFKEPNGNLDRWAHDEERDVEQANASLMFLSRRAIEDVGPFDERFFVYWEETDWLSRAAGRGWRLVFTPEVRAVHSGRSSTDLDSHDSTLLTLESGYRYVRKHFGVLAVIALRLAWVAGDCARLVLSVRRPPAWRGFLLRRLRLHVGTLPSPVERASARPRGAGTDELQPPVLLSRRPDG